MKLLKSLILISLVVISNTNAQSLSDVFNSDKRLVWYGLDFSQAKMIGIEGFSDPYKIVNYYFTNWNEMVNREYKKYDIRKAMHRRDMEYNLDPVRSLNQAVDSGDLVQGNPHKLNVENLASSVKKIKINGDEEGVGMMMVVETFDKLAVKGTYHVVFFDIKSRVVLNSTMLTGEAGGFGFRNYWASSFKEVLDKIQSREYRKWRKKAQN